MSVESPKWHKTTGGKILIITGIAAVITGIVIAVKKFTDASEPSPEKIQEIKDKIKDAISSKPVDSEKNEPTDLPNGGAGCGPVQKAFDRTFDYVKCDGVWWTRSKDRVKIPEWKSLADNKTATDLLNNKYTS